jgi:hypothetical protein
MPGPYFQKSPWNSFSYRENVYDLSHLNEHILEVRDSKKLERTIAITYEDHCFTRKNEPSDSKDLFYPGCTRPSGVFCIKRYNFSLNIRQHIEYAAAGRAWNLKSENYAIVPSVDAEGKNILYSIVFSLDPVKGLPVDLHMRVKTAFPWDEKDTITFGFVRFSHLVTLRLEHRTPNKNTDKKRDKPRV